MRKCQSILTTSISRIFQQSKSEKSLLCDLYTREESTRSYKSSSHSREEPEQQGQITTLETRRQTEHLQRRLL